MCAGPKQGSFPPLRVKRGAADAEVKAGKGGVELTPAEAGAAEDGALLAVVEELAEGLPGADVGRRRPHHAHILVRTRFRHGSAAAAAGRICSDGRTLGRSRLDQNVRALWEPAAGRVLSCSATLNQQTRRSLAASPAPSAHW
jgi:hypothetical protein